LEFSKFEDAVKKAKGYKIKKMGEDGNCLFRSVADQIFGDEDMHDQVRNDCMNYLSAERNHYSQFVTEDFEEYIKRKRQNRVFGNNLEIQAMGEMYNRPIEIYTFKQDKLHVENIFHDQYNTDNAPIRLSYHNGNHYNSVVDPNTATIGVGLGLPSFKPGLADKMLVDKVAQESENGLLEDEIINSLKKEADLEQNEKDLEKIAIEQSQKEYENQMIKEQAKLLEDIFKDFSNKK